VPPTPAQVAAAQDAGEPEPGTGALRPRRQERRAARAERDLATLGKVNPLALEEFAALEERHGFLATQLEDLKATRRDLLTVVRRSTGASTTSSPRPSPTCSGSSSRSSPSSSRAGTAGCTSPTPRTCSPPASRSRPAAGQEVKRLSLLSGGERSLTAVAMLVAIFRARPSPFYVLDEVEAALDDVNLGRLLTLVEQLRSTSQLIVITHQKRTMEIADALYGVSMRGDGITGVISQRLRESEPA
jgi:chromosome segregation protein